MGLPKTIDFSGLSKEHIFGSNTKQYKLLNKIPDTIWGNYVNKMLGKGVLVTYDAQLDQFSAKPQRLKVKESLMKSKKHLNEWYDEEYFDKSQKPEFNAEDFKEVKELCFLLSHEGIEKDEYPRWLIKDLENEDYIAEDIEDYVYKFTTYGTQNIGDAQKMQKFLLRTEIRRNNDSESPYLRGREEQMESKQMKNKFFEGDKIKFNLNEDEIVTGTIHWINEEDNSYEVMLTDGSILSINESDIKQSQKLYEGNYKFKSELTEDEKRSLLFDQNDDEDEDEDGNLPEETSTQEDEIEMNLKDEEEPNFDSEVDSFINGIDDEDESEEEKVVDNSMNKLASGGVEAPNVVSIDDLESVLRKILGNVTSDANDKGVEKTQYPNAEAKEVQENVPPLGQGPQANVLQTDFSNDTTLTQTDTLDTEILKAVYGHSDGEVLDKEFEENKDKIGNVQNRIESEPSYNDYLEGETEEIPDLYNYRKDNHDADGEYLIDDSEFERNAELAGGLGAYSTSDEIGDIFEDNEEVDVLPSVSGSNNENIDDIDDMETQTPQISSPTPSPQEKPVMVNKVVQCSGMPIQIVLSGVMLTMQDVSSIAESVKKKGLKISKIESNKKNELDIIIESNERKYRIHYVDVPALRNNTPFSIKHEKFNSLNEACDRIKKVSKQRLSEKDNFIKLNNSDILNRTINNPKESSILKETKANDDYISTWNVKAVGMVNLKSGLNESFSNIIEHSKESNTLIKTKDGQFYLMKGNLKDRSKIGTLKELVDIQNKKSYGIGRIVGIYENSIKGLGRIMYHTKRTSLPLLIWK